MRLTAVEEELNAIKARPSNVRITGGLLFREDLNQFNFNLAVSANAATSINGNPRTSGPGFGASTQPRGNRPRYEFKLGFDGSVAPDLHFILGLESAGRYQFFNSSNYGFGAGQNGQPEQGAFASIDSAFLDWKPTWAGGTTALWVGRFGTDTSCGGGCYPVQFGPFGLLLNDTVVVWEEANGNKFGAHIADGARIAFDFPGLADLRFQALWVRVQGNVGPLSFPSGEDAYGGDLNFQIIPGLRIGGYYVANSVANSGSSPFTGTSPFGTCSTCTAAAASTRRRRAAWRAVQAPESPQPRRCLHRRLRPPTLSPPRPALIARSSATATAPTSSGTLSRASTSISKAGSGPIPAAS